MACAWITLTYMYGFAMGRVLLRMLLRGLIGVLHPISGAVHNVWQVDQPSRQAFEEP